MSTVRATRTVALSHPTHGALIVVKEGAGYQQDDPLVAAYPWAFVRDNVVEQATAAPGQRRRRKPADG